MAEKGAYQPHGTIILRDSGGLQQRLLGVIARNVLAYAQERARFPVAKFEIAIPMCATQY
jgi:hypothetical protein